MLLITLFIYIVMIVPTGDEWDSDPFEPVIPDGLQ